MRIEFGVWPEGHRERTPSTLGRESLTILFMEAALEPLERYHRRDLTRFPWL